MSVAVILLALAFQGNSPPLDLGQARQKIEAGKLEEARGALAAMSNDNAEVAHLRGLLHLKSRDYPKAIEAFSHVIAMGAPDSAAVKEALVLLGQSYFLTERMPEAVAVLEKAVTAGVRTNEVFYMLAIGHIQSRNPEKAVHAIGGLFNVSADSASAEVLTAQMMIRHHFEEFAVPRLQRALELDPKLAGVHFLLGQIAVYKGELDNGLAEFRQELGINPNSSATYYKIGDVYTRREDWANAIPFLQRAVWLNPDFSGPFILLGKAYLKQKDFENAEGMLRQSIRMDPQNYSAHYLLGQTLLQGGKTDEGRKMLVKSQQLRQAESR
jgi:tetratricopeptide (TPR) repeat protein